MDPTLPIKLFGILLLSLLAGAFFTALHNKIQEGAQAKAKVLDPSSWTPAERALFKFEEQVERPYEAKFRYQALYNYLVAEIRYNRMPWVDKASIGDLLAGDERAEARIKDIRSRLTKAVQKPANDAKAPSSSS